jgi:hypothetical protein
LGAHLQGDGEQSRLPFPLPLPRPFSGCRSIPACAKIPSKTGRDPFEGGIHFWGNQTFTGNGETTQEPMIGELTGKDNKTVVIVDTDGYLNGQIVGKDTLTYCYTQAGGRGPSSVVSCTEIKRQH